MNCADWNAQCYVTSHLIDCGFGDLRTNLHPLMWQSCFYIPPSLRSKSAVTGTPPSGTAFPYNLVFVAKCMNNCWSLICSHIAAGTRGTLQPKSVRRYSGLPSNLKPANNYPPTKSQASIATGDMLPPILII